MKGQRGQALPMAMVALLIGALVVVPFLSHAGTTIEGSRVYASEFNARDAADTGVEHALWSLVWSTMRTQVPNPGNQVTYALPEAVNGFTPNITVKMTVKGSGTGGTAGTINKTILDTLTFDTTGYTPDTIYVTNDVYSAAYRSGSNRGYVKTYTVDADGLISNTTVGSLQIETSSGYEQDMFPVTGNIYGLAYRNGSNRGVVRTMSISTTGVISGAYIDTLNFDNTGYTPSVTKVTNSVYAIAYRGATNRGYLKTVSIDASGNIGNSVLSTLTFDTTACYDPKIIPVTGNYYAIVYRGPTNRGYLKTVSITPAGVIGGAAISTLIFDTSVCYEPDMLNVSGSVYGIAYRGSSNQGVIKTVSINSSGIINGTVISTQAFDTATAYEPAIVNVINDTFAIAYRSTAALGYLKTVSIAANGTISPTIIDTYNFNTSACYEPSLVKVSGFIYGIAFRGSGNAGIFITIGVSDGQSTPINTYEITSMAGGISIKAVVDMEGIITTIRSWIVNQY